MLGAANAASHREPQTAMRGRLQRFDKLTSYELHNPQLFARDTTSVLVLVTSSGEVADCNPLVSTSPIFKTCEKHLNPSFLLSH